ncbi:hypothetical protein [Namhaeicola litoreus]|uniref:Uncharacterized protein n=1 Tax=Namhaeicola litoreus TaxID=1052145 RepID=A0ABW3Y1L3_9FLAO
MEENRERQIKEMIGELKRLADMEQYEELKSKTLELYNSLVILSFQTNNDKKEELSLDHVEPVLEEKQETLVDFDQLKENLLKAIKGNEKVEEEETEVDEPFFVPKFDAVIEDYTLKEEFKDTYSLDDAEKLLEAKPEKLKQLSLHEKLSSNSIQVGLNDRIAFVNNLFNFSQSDFNKVLHFLNDCKTKDEAIQYIQYNVKPKYNWKGKEELEDRLMILIDRKFI